MLRLEPIDDIVRKPVVDHHRAEHRRLGLDVARQLDGFGGGRVGECKRCHRHGFTPPRPALKRQAIE